MTRAGEKNKNEPDELFSKMHSYHPNINLTIETEDKMKRIIYKLEEEYTNYKIKSRP